jgi:oligoendopeptidase F
LGWDLKPFFPSFDGPEYRAFRAALARDLEALLADARALAPLGQANVDAWADLLVRLEQAVARGGHLASYLSCLQSADSRDEAVGREVASAAAARTVQEKLFVLVREALREADDAAFAALAADARIRDVRFFWTRVRERARWTMSEAEENLAAELDPTGLSAWGRLYGQVSGKLEFELSVPGRPARHLPVSMTRTLLEDPDPAVRRAALAG